MQVSLRAFLLWAISPRPRAAMMNSIMVRYSLRHSTLLGGAPPETQQASSTSPASGVHKGLHDWIVAILDVHFY